MRWVGKDLEDIAWDFHKRSSCPPIAPSARTRQLHGLLEPSAHFYLSMQAAAILRHGLLQLLQAAGPKERARISLDLFYQTPLPQRMAVAQVSCERQHQLFRWGQDAATPPGHAACQWHAGVSYAPHRLRIL